MKLAYLAPLSCAIVLAVAGCASPAEEAASGTESPEQSAAPSPEPTVELPADPPAYGVQLTDIDELRAYVEAGGVECDSYSERDVSVEGLIDFRNCNEAVVLATFEDYLSGHRWYLDRAEVGSATLLGDQFAEAPNVVWAVGGPGEVTDLLEEKLGGASSARIAD